jgi:hypothetical protein
MPHPHNGTARMIENPFMLSTVNSAKRNSNNTIVKQQKKKHSQQTNCTLKATDNISLQLLYNISHHDIRSLGLHLKPSFGKPLRGQLSPYCHSSFRFLIFSRVPTITKLRKMTEEKF